MGEADQRGALGAEQVEVDAAVGGVDEHARFSCVVVDCLLASSSGWSTLTRHKSGERQWNNRISSG